MKRTRLDRGVPGICAIAVLTAGLLAAPQAFAQSVPLPKRAPLPKDTAASASPIVVAQAPRPNPPGTIPTPQIPSRPNAPASEAMAIDAKQRALVDKISAYLSGMKQAVGRFVQVGPDGRKSQGELYVQKPGRLRFEYDEPSPVQLIADGLTVAVRDRKLATQDLYPISQTPLRFLLSDKVDLMKDTNVIGVYSDDVFSTVVIEERQAFGGKHKVMLMFDAKNLALKQWTITDPQGFDTTVALSNLDTTKKPDPGLFTISSERNFP
jgi:outer membrane lipoprotein-sorting protein